jgi:AcrR family transcriptional regulator
MPNRPEPRDRILGAARQCFVRDGFDRATMQQVADEAGMSAGNLYRYFPSKDAVVEGLCAADMADLAASFGALSTADDPMAALAALAQRHLVEEPVENAILNLEIWGEAVRSERIRHHVHGVERDIRGWLTAHLHEMQRRQVAVATLDVEAVVDHILTLADGIIVRRARDPGFDAARATAWMVEMVGMAVAGQVAALLRPDTVPGAPEHAHGREALPEPTLNEEPV